LVELMVAVTGGLFVAIAVFMLARDGSRFYQHESKVADATVNAMVGFGRLQADIARAGFLSSPNVRQEPSHCERAFAPTNWSANWPSLVQNLASVRITAPSKPLPAVLTGAPNNRNPDAIILAGSFSNSDEFPTAGFEIVSGTTNQRGVVLQTRVGPLPRLGYLGLTSDGQRLAFLQGIFQADRVLRIVDPSGKTHYGIIQSAGLDNNTRDPNGNPSPLITLRANPAPLLRRQTAFRCALTGTDEGRVSVVNIVRYELRHLTGTSDPGYAPLYANTSATELDAWEQGRTELVREELDATNSTAEEPVVIAGTTEVVAEYAVDLKFGVTAVTLFSTPGPEPAQLTGFPQNNANIPLFAGDPSAGANPQRIRAVRVRLSVRSAVPDRAADIVSGSAIPPGAFFRMQLGPQAFARVRTLQADVALPNHAGIQW
jgi:hypothetical protein